MAVGTTRKLNRLQRGGYLFEKGMDTPVKAEDAVELMEDDRLKIVLEDGDLQPVRATLAGGRPALKTERLLAIQEAVGDLDPDVESNYTSAGLPDARALTKLLGWQVTSAERDEAVTRAAPRPAAKPTLRVKSREAPAPMQQVPVEDAHPV